MTNRRYDDDSNPVAGIALGIVLGVIGWLFLVAVAWLIGRVLGWW